MATGKATSENIIPGSFMKPQREEGTTNTTNRHVQLQPQLQSSQK